MAVDVLNIGRFISVAAIALTVIIANQRQCRDVMGTMLERQTPDMGKQLHVRDFWNVIASFPPHFL